MAYKDKAMAVEYNNKFIAKAYDRINLTVPKGKKDTIQAHAAAQGQSVNSFINRAIDHEMERDASVSPPEAAGALTGAGAALPSETERTAQGAAERTGETVLDFITRAVDTQAQRDKSSLRLGINPATGEKLEKEG